MQELAYLINTNGDFAGAANGTVMDRGPFIDVVNDGYNASICLTHNLLKLVHIRIDDSRSSNTLSEVQEIYAVSEAEGQFWPNTQWEYPRFQIASAYSDVHFISRIL